MSGLPLSQNREVGGLDIVSRLIPGLSPPALSALWTSQVRPGVQHSLGKQRIPCYPNPTSKPAGCLHYSCPPLLSNVELPPRVGRVVFLSPLLKLQDIAVSCFLVFLILAFITESLLLSKCSLPHSPFITFFCLHTCSLSTQPPWFPCPICVCQHLCFLCVRSFPISISLIVCQLVLLHHNFYIPHLSLSSSFKK